MFYLFVIRGRAIRLFSMMIGNFSIIFLRLTMYEKLDEAISAIKGKKRYVIGDYLRIAYMIGGKISFYSFRLLIVRDGRVIVPRMSFFRLLSISISGNKISRLRSCALDGGDYAIIIITT